MPEPLRVEGLRALDYIVAQHVLGWRVEEAEPEPHHVGKLVAWPPGEDALPSWLAWGRGGKPSVESGSLAAPVLRYSSNIAVAWQVDAKARAEGRIARTVVVVTETGENFVTLYPGGGDGRFYGSGGQPTLPLALCVAHLRAVGLDVELAPEAER